MVNVEVVEATMFHVEQMAPNMREADKDEVWAASLARPERALERSLRNSDRCWAGLVDGEVVCMFGVAKASILSKEGIPWMLGTDKLEEYQFAFLRRNKEYVSEMIEGFDTLVNYVDARNKKSIRWLKWLGFNIHDPEKMGALNMPFHKFEMRVA